MSEAAMKYLVIEGTAEEIQRAWSAYESYLRSIRDALPPEVYEFATQSWRYDPTDHRCFHDSWLDELAIREVPRQPAHDVRHLTISLTVLGAYHDGHSRI